MTNVLNGIHEVLDGKGRIITVVGAGGNRDKGKRPLMAKEAAKLSDQVILTSDNPRFEEPDDIINDMVAGLTKMDMERVLCITDRYDVGEERGCDPCCRKRPRRLSGDQGGETSL